MKSMERVEAGVYRRVDLRTGRVLPLLWISYTVNRKLYREGTRTTSIVAARKLRARRLVEMGRGEPGKAAEKICVGELLDAYEVHAKLNGYSSVRTSRGAPQATA